MTKSRIIDFKKVETREKSIVKNNNADVVGFLVSEPKFNHKNLNIQYYVAHIKTPFVSKDGVEKANVLPVLLTERDLQENNFVVGEAYLARGRWSSVRHEDGTFSEFLFAKKIIQLDKETVQHRNHSEIDGYVRRRPVIRECYNTYKGIMEKQAETLVTIPRPAGKNDDGTDKIKTDTVTIAFRGNFVKAALNLQQGDRIDVKGYLEECKDENGDLVKYVVIATDVTIKVESEEKPAYEAPVVETPVAEAPVEEVTDTEE